MRIRAKLFTVLFSCCLAAPLNAQAYEGERAFCEAIQQGRDAYRSATRVVNEQARQLALAQTIPDALQKLRQAVADGQIRGWRAKIANVTRHRDGSAAVVMTLSCDVILRTDVSSGILPGAQLYNALSNQRNWKYINLDGNFFKGEGMKPFWEVSINDDRMFDQPEFIIGIQNIRD